MDFRGFKSSALKKYSGFLIVAYTFKMSRLPIHSQIFLHTFTTKFTINGSALAKIIFHSFKGGHSGQGD
jgi:hypothetical protein